MGNKGSISSFKQTKICQYISLFILYFFMVQVGTSMLDCRFVPASLKQGIVNKNIASKGLWDYALSTLNTDFHRYCIRHNKSLIKRSKQFPLFCH
jgi:hypothetical protein